MKSEAPLQTLEGILERLTYQNEENGYTVARLIPTGKQTGDGRIVVLAVCVGAKDQE